MAITAPAHAGSTTAQAVEAKPVQKIIVETRDICGSGRVADMHRNNALKRAKKIATELRAKGKEVEILQVAHGLQVGYFGDHGSTAPVFIRGC